MGCNILLDFQAHRSARCGHAHFPAKMARKIKISKKKYYTHDITSPICSCKISANWPIKYLLGQPLFQKSGFENLRPDTPLKNEWLQYILTIIWIPIFSEEFWESSLDFEGDTARWCAALANNMLTLVKTVLRACNCCCSSSIVFACSVTWTVGDGKLVFLAKD